MPEYSSTTITPADGVKTPAMNGSTSGNYTLADLRAFILASKGLANGLASLDANGKLTSSQLPDLADDVLVYGSYALLPSPGIAGKLYITADDNQMYRWDDALTTPDYVVLSVDLSAYATKAEMEAADTDLKNALSATNARVENLEQEHGSYHDVDVKSVYTIPSGKAKNWSVNVLRGVTRGKDQLAQAYTSGYATRVSDTEVSVSFSAGNTSMPKISYDIPTISGHYYLVYMKESANANVRTFNAGVVKFHYVSEIINGVAEIVQSDGTTSYFQIRDADSSVGGNGTFTFFVRDLTLYFNGNIPSDADTIAEIQQNYPELLVPSAYGNSLLSTRYEGVRTTSPYNIWNEEWELGRYDNSTGEKINASTSIRSKDFTYVEPNDRLYVLCTSIGMRIFFYGINKNFVSTQILYNTSDFTVASGVYYFTFQTGNDGNPITTYGNNIQFCPYSYTEERDTYHHHLLDTLSLPTPITLRSAGSVAEEYNLESGEVTHPTRLVNLGTLTWKYETWNGLPNFYTNDLKNIIKGVTPTTLPNLTSDMFPIVVFNANQAGTSLGLSVSGSGNLDCRITNGYTDVTSFTNWVNNHYIVIELATADPSTQLDPIQNPYLATESGGTISSILTDAVDDSMTLGYINL